METKKINLKIIIMKTIYFTAIDGVGYTINPAQITIIMKHTETQSLIKLSCGTELIIPISVEDLIKKVKAEETGSTYPSEPIH